MNRPAERHFHDSGHDSGADSGSHAANDLGPAARLRLAPMIEPTTSVAGWLRSRRVLVLEVVAIAVLIVLTVLRPVVL